jgi:hypothetical protein
VGCLFLGGGTSTAAFQWCLGAVPVDLHISEFFLRARGIIAQHFSFIVLAVILGLTFVVGLIYTRCVLRFALIEAVIKHDIAMSTTWNNVHSYGRSYFLWLLGVVGAVLVAVSGFVLLSFRSLSFLGDAAELGWVRSSALVAELVAIVIIGLLVAIAITLTDDLAAPIMYAGGISLPAAWRIVWAAARHDRATFLFYLAMRFALSMGISVAALVILFPLLMGLSSAALVIAALSIFALRLVGMAWAWNTVTITLGALALTLFTGLLFGLLSVVGMPGQVYLQNYGVHFIGSRVPFLGALCRAFEPQQRRGDQGKLQA